MLSAVVEGHAAGPGEYCASTHPGQGRQQHQPHFHATPGQLQNLRAVSAHPEQAWAVLVSPPLVGILVALRHRSRLLCRSTFRMTFLIL